MKIIQVVFYEPHDEMGFCIVRNYDQNGSLVEVPSSQILYKILVESTCSFYGQHNKTYKKVFQN
jgi:hypothetical protein